MASGAVERSGARAHAYAGLRVQGGRAIVGHDAVAELLADVDGGLTRRLVSYRPTTPWEQDTHDLPAPIGRRRREVRSFADRTMRPVAAELDLALRDGGTMPEGARDVLVQAGRAGLLSDLLPVPLTLESLRRGLRSLVLNQAVAARSSHASTVG